MDKLKRSYYLSQKLIDTFTRECGKSGYVKEKVVAAAVLRFLQSDASARAKMFDRLDAFEHGSKK